MAAIVVIAGLSLPAAACGSGSPGSRTAQLGTRRVAFSACMRAHGVSSYPDPDSSGALPKVGLRQLGVSSGQFQSAQAACRHLLPAGGSLQQQEVQCAQNGDCSPSLLREWLTAARRLARCMRSHGMPRFPDPTADSSGVVFDISRVGISDAESHSPHFMHELDVCGRIVGDFPESFG